MNSKKEIWIINGIPGSGKSTTAKALAKSLPTSAHIEGDKIQDFIISGKVSPGEQPKDEENRQIHLCLTNQCLVAKSMGDSGFTPVIDYVVVSKERIDEYKKNLEGYNLLLVTLNPGIKKALERDARRPEKTVAKEWIHLEDEMKQNIGDLGLWVDNSAMTIAETVTYILQNRQKALI